MGTRSVALIALERGLACPQSLSTKLREKAVSKVGKEA